MRICLHGPMRHKKFVKRLGRAVRVISFGGSLGVLLLLVGLGVTLREIYRDLEESLSSVAGVADYRARETTRIFSRDGTLIAALSTQDRTSRKLSEISPHVVDALLATEDTRFYQHSGVDARGILRAARANLVSGQVEQGASTIPMQLARHFFLDHETSLERKVLEALLALKLDREYTKDRLLELYLNEMYFGAGAYGIGSAASRYFRRQPADLTPAQSALLIGMLQAPTELSPYVDRPPSLRRQLVILGRMRELGYLTAAQQRSAIAEAKAMRFDRPPRQDSLVKFPYYTDYVVRELLKRYPEEVVNGGGLRVYTALDVGRQKMAEASLRRRLDQHGGSLNVGTGALVLLDNHNVHVVAMVGGRQWTVEDQFNRAWQSRRQAGSTFKALVYTAALERGYTPDSVVRDEKITVVARSGESWTPRNADGAFMGRIRMSTAVRLSRNVVAARLVNELGVPAILELSRRMGIDRELPPYPSIALGAAEVSPLELVEVFSVYANRGIHREPVFITSVVDRDGKVLRQAARKTRTALAPSIADAMGSMLRGAVVDGTGRAASLPGYPVAGKTGTTDDSRDAWFVGYTSRFSLAVWVGNDDFRPMGGVYGGNLPAWIFRDVMAQASIGVPAEPLPLRTRNRTVKLCRDSGKLARKGCPRRYISPVAEGSALLPACTRMHGQVVRAPDFAHPHTMDSYEYARQALQQRKRGGGPVPPSQALPGVDYPVADRP